MNPLNDVADERGGGATRNAHAGSTTCRATGMIHHMLPEVPVRTSSLRGLGAWANVFAIEMLHGRAGRDRRRGPGRPTGSLCSRIRAHAAWIETAAADERLVRGAATRRGPRARFGLCPLQEHRVVRRRGGRARGRGRHHAPSASGAAPTRASWIAPDGASNQLEGGIIQGASFVMHEQVQLRGRPGRDRQLGGAIRSCASPRCLEIDIELIDNPNEPTLGLGEAAVGPTGAAIGNARRTRARQAGRATCR